MIKYILYLLLYIPVQLIAYIVTPVLPLFAYQRNCRINNNSKSGWGPKLPDLLSWFDTPDNSLMGDYNWALTHPRTTYLDQVAWLYRNSLYGFKWSVLAAPSNQTVCTVIEGPNNLNHHTKTYGVMRITRTDGYWQYKCVKPFMGKILVLNMGWLLDDPSQERALFMCSPRLK